MNTTIDTLLHWQLRYPALIGALAALVKTTAVLAGAWTLSSLLSHRSARARSWVWRGAMLGLAMLAVWEMWPMPKVELPVMVSPMVMDSAPTVAVVHTAPLVIAPPAWHVVALRHLDQHLDLYWQIGFAIALGWTFLRAGIGLIWLRWHSQPAPEALRNDCPKRLRCRVAARLSSPLITGMIWPTVWMPAESLSWPTVKLHAAFQHELAHHLRRDVLWQRLASLAAVLWWWQPLSWFGLNKLKGEAEQAADDWSVTESITVPDYAEALVAIATEADTPCLRGVGISMARPHQIEQRVRALLRDNPWRNRLGGVVSAALFMFALGLAGIVLVSCKARPQQYVSLAKLVAGGRMGSTVTNGPNYIDYLQDFYGTVIETLESPEMHKHAQERVRALSPDLKPCEVKVQVTQNKGSAIFNVAAFGTDPKYTRAFLDALLDEFRAFRDQIREQQRNKALTALAEDVVKRETDMKNKAEAFATFKKNNNVVILSQSQAQSAEFLKALNRDKNRIQMDLVATGSSSKDLPGAVARRERAANSGEANAPKLLQAEQDYLKTKSDAVRLKTDLDHLTQTRATTHPDVNAAREKLASNEAYLAALGAQLEEQYAEMNHEATRTLAMLDEKIGEFTKMAIETGKKLAEHDHLQKDFEESQRAHRELFDLVHKFQVSEEITTDHVTIMERASPAVNDIQPWWSF
jgi:hypothetical protein